MKRILVKFQWTELFKVSDIGSVINSRFHQISTNTEKYTFKEIIQIHQNNFKGTGEISSDFGYLTNDFRNCSSIMSLDSLRKMVEERDVLYVINLDRSSLYFTPMVKTQKELDGYKDFVKSFSPLD